MGQGGEVRRREGRLAARTHKAARELLDKDMVTVIADGRIYTVDEFALTVTKDGAAVSFTVVSAAQFS